MTVLLGRVGNPLLELEGKSPDSAKKPYRQNGYCMMTFYSASADSPMNQTIWRFQCVVSWIFCALVFGLSPVSFGQATLPPLETVQVPNFTIPFEVEASATSYREVELLVSKDRGRRWHSVTRQPVESGKFAFRADSDGEYWFAFRTIAANGNASPLTGHPHLRVLVNTRGTMVTLPSRPSESGPVTPPKPERVRTGTMLKPPSQPMKADALETVENPGLSANAASLLEKLPLLPLDSRLRGNDDDKGNDGDRENDDNEENDEFEEHSKEAKKEGKPALLAPKLPGFEPPAPGTGDTENLLDNLLSGMRPFMDVQPVEIKRVVSEPQIASPTSNIPGSSADAPAGSIARIDLNNTAAKPQIVVQWHTGHELWKDAQIDIFRGSTKAGPWSPIAINLANSGEYWWFLTPEDLKPFHIAVRIRSLYGGIQMDVTQSAITIDPKLTMFQGERRRE